MAAITILLFVQILSNGFAQLPTVVDDEILEEDVEIPSLTSARNNTSCGSNSSLTDLWASTDSSTWGTWTNAVYGYYDVNCTVIGNNYTLEATISNSAGGWSSYSFWNWSETNNHEYMSEAWSNLTAGTYCVNATLWDVTSGTSTYVDSDYPCFTLTNSSGSGGNNTGGNNSSSMEQINLLYIAPWGMNYTTNDNLYFYWLAEDLVTNISYNATFDVYAYNVTTNTTYVIWDDYTIFDSNSTNWNPAWNGSGPSFDSHWQIPNGTLPTGCYYASINLYDNDDGMHFDNDGFDLDIGMNCSNAGGNNTGGNNTGGNNTGNSTDDCGTLDNLTDLMVWSDSTMYFEGDVVGVEFITNCTVLNKTYTLDYTLYDSNNNSVADNSANPWTWVANNVYEVHSANFTLSADTYCLWVHLEDAFAAQTVETETHCFDVNESGNSSGNNTAGNNQTNPIMPVNCSQINWDVGPSNVTIDDCWNQTNSFWFFFNQSGVSVWIDPVVAVGYDYVVYSGPSIVSVEIPVGYGDDVFDLYVFWNNGWHDSGFDIYGGVPYTFSTPVERMSIRGIEASEMLDPNDPTAFVSALTFQTSGTVLMTMTPVTENYTVLTCGNDPSMTDLMIWTDAQSYPQGTTVYSDYYVNCSVNTKDYELHVFAYSTSGGTWSDYAVWNWTETDSYEMMDDSWSNLAQDTYCVNATLYMVSGGAYQFVDFEVTCFTVTGNSSGGGGSTPLDPCGLNSSYTQVWSWMDASTYANGDDQDATFYVNCTRTGADYTLEYYVFEVGSTNYVLSGMYTWVANSININFYDTFTGLGPGDYCVLANLYEANVFLTDNGGTTCFTITGTAVNSPPTISYTLQIPVAYSGDALDCYAQGATYSDPDNDPDQSIFTWNVNNVQITTGILNNILPAGSFVVGDIVHCEAIAHDGMAQGNTMNRYYFVQPPNNTAPSVSNVLITPPSPVATDTLTCSYTYSDPDMDPDASLIQWSINGVAIAGATTDTLSSGYATADFVTCAVTAFDGTVSGNTGTMSILIMSSASSGGGGLPSVGVIGTIAAIAIGFIFTTRREDEE